MIVVEGVVTSVFVIVVDSVICPNISIIDAAQGGCGLTVVEASACWEVSTAVIVSVSVLVMVEGSAVVRVLRVWVRVSKVVVEMKALIMQLTVVGYIAGLLAASRACNLFDEESRERL